MELPTILQIKRLYYPILAAFGAPANLMTMVILSKGKCGLSKCISVYMGAMATADLLVMIFNVMVYHILRKHFPYSFLSYTAVCKFMIYMCSVSLYMSVWFTVSFTFDRFVAICCQKFKTKYCTMRTAAVVITTLSVLVYLENIPFWFAYEHKELINNVPWGFIPNASFFSSPAGIAFSQLENILITYLPFALIILFNCLTVRRILLASRVRTTLRGRTSENQNDPEMENRRKSIILLFVVSGSFILLWLTSALSSVVNNLAAHHRLDYTSPAYIATEAGYMLMYLSSCTNTCIYAASQTKFREELKKVVKYPWTFFLILVTKNNNQTKASCPN